MHAEYRQLARIVLDKGFLRQVVDEAQHSINDFEYSDSSTTDPGVKLIVRATGNLNPLSSGGHCQAEECKRKSAHEFGRLSALFFDEAVIADSVTGFCCSIDPEKELDSFEDFFPFVALAANVAVLRELEPLIEAGIVRLGRPGAYLCEEHRRQANSAIDEATAELVQAVLTDSKTRVLFEDNAVRVDSELVSPYPLNFLGSKVASSGHEKEHQLTLNEALELRPILHQELKGRTLSALVDANGAARQGAVLASGARADVAVLAALDQAWHAGQRLDDWELARRVRLPYIERLSPEEALEVREKAKSALKPFRARISKGLGAVAAGSNEEKAVKTLVSELQTEAVELESELDSVRQSMGMRPWVAAGAD